ncbi:hypothetical protein LP420_30810 [Massilia sp. B-10]|nr:hypothetical protein LP420_30810 [Massilia sp. B-10]
MSSQNTQVQPLVAVPPVAEAAPELMSAVFASQQATALRWRESDAKERIARGAPARRHAGAPPAILRRVLPRITARRLPKSKPPNSCR